MNALSLPPIERGPEYASLSMAPESWAFAAWDVDRLRAVNNGKGVICAVLDTGGDVNHPELTGRIDASKDFTGSSYGFADRNGHGTHCLGTVGGSSLKIGVANGCRLLNGKVLGDSGSGSDSGIAAGIDWAVEQGAAVISMSLGSSSPSQRIKDACDRAAVKGVWVVAAAGNEGNAGVGYPGGFPSCMSVAAVDRNFKVAGFSSRGNKLDTSGPGVQIVSAKPGGSYQEMSGTSMATPFVAGLLTCLRGGMIANGAPIPNTEELRRLLFNRSVDLGTPGDDTSYGPGWLAPLMLAMGATADPPAIK